VVAMINTPQEIEQGMIRKNIELQKSIEEIPALIANMAEAERDFDIALAHKILTFKAENKPITIINKLAAGDKFVSELKFNYNLQKELLKIQYTKIDAIKVAIGSYQSMHALRRIEYQKASISPEDMK